jgi:serine/threonine-protein phosphatase 4 regulatory subunit 1
MHRLFILHHLPAFLEDITPTEAVEYVLPLLPALATDEGKGFL